MCTFPLAYTRVFSRIYTSLFHIYVSFPHVYVSCTSPFTYTCVCSRVYVSFHMHMSLFKFVGTFRYVRFCSHFHMCTSLFTYTCIFSHIYVSFHIYTSLFTYILLFPTCIGFFLHIYVFLDMYGFHTDNPVTYTHLSSHLQVSFHVIKVSFLRQSSKYHICICHV